jgi:hypothetical protein
VHALSLVACRVGCDTVARACLQSFLQGLAHVFPAHLLRSFSLAELRLVLSGTSQYSVDELLRLSV